MTAEPMNDEARNPTENQNDLFGEEKLERQQILEEIKDIRKQLHTLNSHRLLKIYNSIARMLLFNFVRGVATGFGTVFGATVVVSVFIYILSTIEFIPIIGEWVSAIIKQVEVVHPPSLDPDPSVPPENVPPFGVPPSEIPPSEIPPSEIPPSEIPPR